ncbi:hypothetical protein FQA39_LY07937 [Lamprigera yunnana]|nr:hypothetical protein FQA39_LY07937 [Lamprigera yunnana]
MRSANGFTETRLNGGSGNAANQDLKEKVAVIHNKVRCEMVSLPAFTLLFLYGDVGLTLNRMNYYRRQPILIRNYNPYCTFQQTGTFPSVRIYNEHNAERHMEDGNLNDVQPSSRCLARGFGVKQSMVWRTLKGNEMYPYHLKLVRHLHSKGRRLDLEE